MTAVLPSNAAPGALLCPRCGSALRDEQSWCLECGLAARTRIHPTPNWRLPIATALVLLALLVAGIAVALVTLLDEREPPPATTTVTVPAAAPTSTAPAATTPPVATTPTFTAPPATSTPSTVPTIPSFTTPTTTPRSYTVPGTNIEIPIPASSR